VLIKEITFDQAKKVLLVSGIISGNARNASGRPLGHITNQAFTNLSSLHRQLVTSWW
jgi:hypothetical protein